MLAFAAGFSERWAQDTLTGGLTGRGRARAAAATAATAPTKQSGAQHTTTAATDTDLASD